MKISFVIPAYNEEFLLEGCLDSVLVAVKNTPCDHEIIVVNNASTDRTAAIAASYANKGVRLVNENRKGLVWARKAGYDVSTGDLIANIDADVIIPKNWLPKVLKEFSDDPKLLALSGPLFYYDAPLRVRISTKMFYIGGYIMDKINQTLFKSGSLLQGGNFTLRRSALEAIGGFDTSIEFYAEDTDIGRRIRQVGKAKWTFSLPMYSSGRRFAKQGIIMTGILYGVNFFWVTFMKKPFSTKYIDVRINKNKKS